MFHEQREYKLYFELLAHREDDLPEVLSVIPFKTYGDISIFVVIG